MISLIRLAYNNTKTTLLILTFIFIAGISAYKNIPKESDPDITIPMIYVNMNHEGISPEDAETLLLKPMEQEIRRIEGIKEVRSTGFEGGGSITVEFQAGLDTDKALDDVREKVDLAKADLPTETDEPQVREINFSQFPVLVITLSGNIPERTLYKLADDVKDAVEIVPSVLEAKVVGDREDLAEIIIDPLRMESYNLVANDVANLFARNNRLVAAGALDTGYGRFSLKVPGLFKTAEDILNMPVKVDGDSIIRLKDIATGGLTYKDRTNYARVDGKSAVAIEVSKRAGENIIETIEKVKAIVNEESAKWPPELKIKFSQDKSDQIIDMLGDLENNVLTAVLLVMVVIVSSLGLRAGTLVGLAIPGSFLMGILVISMMGYTMNIVVLFALIFSVGMLVDDAIIVIEYASRRMEEGVVPKVAYLEATERMAMPVIASTATRLAAFFPLLFWPGIPGEFMKFLPITLIATLTASLFMALLFLPCLGQYISASAIEEADVKKSKFTQFYVKWLKKALDHPFKVISGTIALLFAAIGLSMIFGKGVEFFPNVEPENALVYVHARGNLSVDEQDKLVREVENRILPLKYFKSIYTSSGKESGGGGGGRSGPGPDAEDIIGTITLEMGNWQTRPKAFKIMEEIRELTKDISGIIVEVQKEQAGPPTGKPIQVQLRSMESALLKPWILKIRRYLEQDADFLNLEDDLPTPGIEWEVDVDRAEASKYGADISVVGETIKMVTNGILLSTYRPEESDDDVDIVIRFPKKYRNLSELSRLRVVTTSGVVPISNFVKTTAKPQVTVVKRLDGRRTHIVKADVKEGIVASTKLDKLKAWLDKQDIPRNLEVEFTGDDEEQEKSAAFLKNAFGASLFVMMIILVAQYNSFYQTFVTLSAVIFSTIGVFIGMLIMNQAFSIVMNGLGVVALGGIIVNNNIILIDTYKRLREEYPTIREALINTGEQRLRPVLLTAITAVLGLLPLIFLLNIDILGRNITYDAPSAQWWVQLSTAIGFGLTFATALTLILTPCFLLVWENRVKKRA